MDASTVSFTDEVMPAAVLLNLECLFWTFSYVAYMSSLCHIELIVSEKEEPVKKEVRMDHNNFIPGFALWSALNVVESNVLDFGLCRLSHRLRPGRPRLGSFPYLLLEWITSAFYLALAECLVICYLNIASSHFANLDHCLYCALSARIRNSREMFVDYFLLLLSGGILLFAFKVCPFFYGFMIFCYYYVSHKGIWRV
jgi:hypothetical protein